MMFFVSDAKGNSRPSTTPQDSGVLVNLPRTRPQRASPRRAAARKTTSGARRSAATDPRGSAPRRDAAPRQGFESESESMTGSVQPPGSAELVASAVEMIGELAKVGLSTGERVSMALLSIAIHARGFEAISFTGSQSGILTNDRHFDARIIEVRPHRIEDELDAPKHLARVIHRQYFEPSFPEFAPRTKWSLQNAFTSGFKLLDPVPQFKATASFGEFFNSLN